MKDFINDLKKTVKLEKDAWKENESFFLIILQLIMFPVLYIGWIFGTLIFTMVVIPLNLIDFVFGTKSFELTLKALKTK